MEENKRIDELTISVNALSDNEVRLFVLDLLQRIRELANLVFDRCCFLFVFHI